MHTSLLSIAHRPKRGKTHPNPTGSKIRTMHCVSNISAKKSGITIPLHNEDEDNPNAHAVIALAWEHCDDCCHDITLEHTQLPPFRKHESSGPASRFPSLHRIQSRTAALIPGRAHRTALVLLHRRRVTERVVELQGKPEVDGGRRWAARIHPFAVIDSNAVGWGLGTGITLAWEHYDHHRYTQLTLHRRPVPLRVIELNEKSEVAQTTNGSQTKSTQTLIPNDPRQQNKVAQITNGSSVSINPIMALCLSQDTWRYHYLRPTTWPSCRR
ncbi:hypothetical protein FN846DRAFT_887145 [Sphaerosporella brunnea]|uniref:Uncharacterized protein n=1 Tax=Sphaerosporella brunnea TaxID=1250544 RepID=A0A5J5F7A5_9PEZI|nr:hypothetical protein FN846DRAFT_887145 [Sphaerosporella brunnea]